MSTTPSPPHRRRRIDAIACALVLAMLCTGAYALKSDRAQTIQVAADHQEASLGNQREVSLSGHVKIDQGSLGIAGDKAIGYENQDHQWDHAVVTGTPATFHQKLDDGGTVRGSAATIDYLVAENTVILTGHATVEQTGRGSFRGAKLTYNTDTGKIVGEGGTGGQVHMTFQPKSSPAKPAPASATAAGTH